MFVAFAPVTAAAVGLPDPRAVTAAIPLVLAGVLMWRRWLPRLAACLMLVAGASLRSGWLHTGVAWLVHWVTWLINLVTRTAAGGVVPGALALVLLVYFVLEMRPAPGAVGQLRALPAGRSGSRGYTARSRRSATRTARGLPGKLGAAGVGLVLPSVATAMTGDLGAVVLSALNVIGGAFAWPLTLAWGVA